MALSFVENITDLIVKSPPSPTGYGTRQSQIPSNRLAKNTRHIMKWIIPEQPVVEMYINPQNIQIQDEKLITEQRTKGGYTLQYWGENIKNISLSGTTGTSGVEGLNVLYDVYRNEQLMFDPYALTLESEYQKQEQDNFDSLLGINIEGSLSDIANFLDSSNKNNTVSSSSRAKPTLASLAFSVEMYWMGEIYRGYFKSMSATEGVDSLGLFSYNINFRALQKRGFRTNFLAWHKSPNGVAETPPKYRELSYKYAEEYYITTNQRQQLELIDQFDIY
jgi:hypothetical protein